MGDKLIRQMLADWVLLARQAGLSPGAFQPGETWQRKDQQRSQVVLRMDGPDQSVILKRVFSPVDQIRFRAAMAGQRRAEEALRAHPTASAPRVLAVDEGACACLMTCAPGRSLDAICAEVSDPLPAIRRAGEWMAAFHAASDPTARQFQPRFMVDHLIGVARDAEEDRIKIRARGEFLRFARQIPLWAKPFQGGATLSAAKHGDMNMRNLLLAENGQTTGIDFSGQGSAPVGFDIARFLMNYAEVYADLDALQLGVPLSEPVRAAFFEGYGLVGPDDPSVAFLLKVQLLTDWARVPPEGPDATMLHDIQLQRIRKLAQIAFA